MLNRFQSPAEVAFSVSGFNVYWYGIVLAVSVFVGFLVAYYLGKKFYGEKESRFVSDYSPYLVIIGVICARLYYCLVNFDYYTKHIEEVLNIRQGGLSIHGMIIFGILTLFIFAKYKKVSFLKLADIYLCGTLFAQSIGRWGNFFNSEAFGYPTDVVWKLYIPITKRPVMYSNCEYFHPTFLYESILDFVGFVILVLNFKRLSKYPGLAACFYLIYYSTIRIFVEHFRIDSALNISGIPIAQIVSGILIILAIFFGIYIIKMHNTKI